MSTETITVPDIGGSENVDVIEVCVAVGDDIAVDDPILVLESDKASMDVPSPMAGKVLSINVKEGDKVSEGDAVLELEVGEASESEEVDKEPESAEPEVDTEQTNQSTSGGEVPVNVPDIGGAESVDVIEICVAVGDEVSEGDALIVLESDKASMDIPSPAAGTVLSIAVKEGAKVGEGDAICVLSSSDAASSSSSDSETSAEPEAKASSADATETEVEVDVPDIGDVDEVDVIEVCVKEGDELAEGDSLIVLESDKASMEVPAPSSGTVTSVVVKLGDKVSKGSLVLKMRVTGAEPAATKEVNAEETPTKASNSPVAVHQRTSEKFHSTPESAGSAVYAGPASRKLAREMGVDLTQVKGSGPRARISKDDIKAYVKGVLQGKGSAAPASTSGIPPIPEVDYAKFGDVEIVKMDRIKKLTVDAMSLNWLNVPRVTQFDDADITEMESFRKSMKAEAEKAGVKLTPIPFLIKAVAAALKAEPSFNVAVTPDLQHIVQKKYIHVSVAVDTPRGLMVPVVRDADKKSLFELAAEVTELAEKARDGKLKPAEMQGGCFSISSLGAIGGTGFSPVVSTTEAGILGVSKAVMKPVWDGSEFQPRLMLPLSLSYDHKAVNGSDAGRFMTYLVQVISDIRRLLL